MMLEQLAATLANITAGPILFALLWIYAIGVCWRLASASVAQDQHYRDTQPDWPPFQRPADCR